MSYVDIDPFTADNFLEKFKVEEVSIYPEPPCENGKWHITIDLRGQDRKSHQIHFLVGELIRCEASESLYPSLEKLISQLTSEEKEELVEYLRETYVN